MQGEPTVHTVHHRCCSVGPAGQSTDHKESAVKALLPKVLSAGSGDALAALPLPVIDLIVGYTEVVRWRLASSPPGLYGPFERLSDLHARLVESEVALITGDTPLSAGVHAWRVTVEVEEAGNYMVLGIVEAGRAAAFEGPESACSDRSCFGVQTYLSGYRTTAGVETKDSGLEEICSGDTLDFVLDVAQSTLTVITRGDGRRCVFELPALVAGGKEAWVPMFCTLVEGNSVAVEIIEPEQAGK